MGRSVGYSFRIILIVITASLSLSSWASTVGLLVDAPSDQIMAFQRQINALLPKDTTQLISVPELKSLDFTTVDKWLTLGPNALNQLLRQLKQFKSQKTPVLALFLPESARRKLLTEFQGVFTALDNTPDMSKQLALIHALAPQAKQVGVFYSSQYDTNRQKIEAKAKQFGLNLHWAQLSDPLDWDRQALKVLADVDLVLGVDDDALYNTTTIRSILMRLYRSGKALVGPDKGYVRAGAVASTHSGIQETLLAAAEWITKAPDYSAKFSNPYFNISVNTQVARSLNIVVDDVPSLIQQVKESTNEK